jgi:hypothetical protein
MTSTSGQYSMTRESSENCHTTILFAGGGLLLLAGVQPDGWHQHHHVLRPTAV